MLEPTNYETDYSTSVLVFQYKLRFFLLILEIFNF